MRIRTVTALLAMTAVSFAAAAAEEMRLVLDRERTAITFELDATLHSVHGTAQLTEGVVVFDSASGEASGGIVVATGSADTSHEGRDEDMHVKVLETTLYPEIAFRPTAIRGELAPQGESRVELEGVFTIHGDEHPLTIEALTVVDGETLEATVEFEVPYVSWGMKNPSKLLLKVAKQVQVRIHGVGTLTPVDGTGGMSSAGS